MTTTTISTAILCVLILAVCIVTVKLYKKKLSSGCCGAGGDQTSVKRSPVSDRNKAHYPIVKRLSLDGMVCQNCAIRVENALNAIEGVWATVDLTRQEALVRMKQPVGYDELKSAVKGCGYVLVSESDAS